MKKSIIAIAALLMLLACGGKQSQTKTKHADTDEQTSMVEEESKEDLKEESKEDSKEVIEALIHDLYAAAARNEGDIDQRFACHEWCDMVEAVKKKDAQLEEIGFFNEDYWTQMQDSNPDDLEAREIKFVEFDAEEGTALVDFLLDSSVQFGHLQFSFCRDDGEWRVHDIISFYVNANAHEDFTDYMVAMRDYLNGPEEEE